MIHFFEKSPHKKEFFDFFSLDFSILDFFSCEVLINSTRITQENGHTNLRASYARVLLSDPLENAYDPDFYNEVFIYCTCKSHILQSPKVAIYVIFVQYM